MTRLVALAATAAAIGAGVVAWTWRRPVQRTGGWVRSKVTPV